MRPIDEAIRVIPVEWFEPSPALYWLDLLASAGAGWTAFAFAVRARGWARAGLLVVSICALYRAVLFIHEITHRSPRDLPAFRAAWNLLVGIPLLIPSFLYEGVHLDHHRARSYGTAADPEYVPFGRRTPILMSAFVLGSLIAPFAFAVRFGLLAPIAWAVPSLRRPVAERCSSLVINHAYIRHAAIGPAGRIAEIGACGVVWLSLWLTWIGVLPLSVLGCWAIASATAFGVNAIRTLAAHRYDHDAGELSMTEQLLDSCTIQPARGWRSLAGHVVDAVRTLVAPVGLRYHALHHWIPALPYHRLGRTHRLLVATLREDAPYLETIEPGFSPALTDLVRRSTAYTRAGGAVAGGLTRDSDRNATIASADAVKKA